MEQTPKFSITRKEDGYRILSNSIKMQDQGVWILDDLESGGGVTCFIPWHNVLQINNYEPKKVQQ